MKIEIVVYVRLCALNGRPDLTARTISLGNFEQKKKNITILKFMLFPIG